MKEQKHYKVILTLFKNGERLEKEAMDEMVGQLIKEFPDSFFRNKNRDKDKHYPLYYDNIYYFGEPIVLTAISEAKLKSLLEYFKRQGLSWWVTYVYECYNFEYFRHKRIQMLDNNMEREYLFFSSKNLVNKYKEGKAIIQDETEINKIIEATK